MHFSVMQSNPLTARGVTTTGNENGESVISDSSKHNGTVLRFIGEQGKRARFYRNGDQFFKGFWYTISAFRSWNSLLEDLNHHLGDSIALPHGVRFIFSVDGVPKYSLEEMEHGLSYVCSSTEKFKAIDYTNAYQPMWSFVSSQKAAPPSRGLHLKCEKEPNDFVQPKIITIIRNGLKPRRVVRHLLNKRTAQSFDHVMQDITAIVKLNSGVVRKLFALSGRQIMGLSDFFSEDYVFVAYGPEKVSVDDFYVITEEYKRMNLRGGVGGSRGVHLGSAGKCEMPIRNDGFRKTLSPDPRAKMNQVMKLPQELAEKIKIVELLGDGNTALVFKALFKNKNQPSENDGVSTIPDALKIISKENADEMLDFVETEIKILSEINHEYIVAMREFHVVDNSWYIRMELMEEGDLFEYLTKKRVLKETDAASCIFCLCNALAYLHDRKIVHRDVKLENLLVYRCQSTGNLKLKLADFGLACKLKDDELLYHLCGTPTYVAPEVLAEFGYSYKADCWSVGIILYILICGFPPFGMDEDLILFNKIIRGVFDFPSPSFDDISFAARLLIRRLLTTEPKTRFSARQILEYFWVEKPGKTNIELEQTCMEELEKAMSSFSKHYNNKFEKSNTEYFYSRRASMDELSDCAASVSNFDTSMTPPQNIKTGNILFQGNHSLNASNVNCTFNYDVSSEGNFSHSTDAFTEGNSLAKNLFSSCCDSVINQQQDSIKQLIPDDQFCSGNSKVTTQLNLITNNYESLNRKSARSSFELVGSPGTTSSATKTTMTAAVERKNNEGDNAVVAHPASNSASLNTAEISNVKSRWSIVGNSGTSDFTTVKPITTPRSARTFLAATKPRAQSNNRR